MEEFQRFPHVAREIFLYSWTNFRILKPSAFISNLLRLDLGFWWPSKQIYRKLKYRDKVLEDFQRLCRFPRETVLYLSTKFGILKPSTIISNLMRFDLGCSQASKPFSRKLNYRENVLEEFQRFPRFPRKMVLYSSTNFCILKPSAIISNLLRFDLGFWRASKQIYRKLKYRRRFWKSFNVCLAFPEKWFRIR